MTDATATPASEARSSDELLPFLNNFHDIFTTIGVVILFVGLALGGTQVFDRIDPAEGTVMFDAVWLSLLGAVGGMAWLVSAVLVGRQRRILPGIVLSVIFASAASIVAIYLYTQLTVVLNNGQPLDSIFDALAGINEPSRDALGSVIAELPWAVRIFPVGVGLIISAVIWLYYSRFRLPFAAGLLGVALVTTGFAVFAILEPYLAFIWNPTASLVTGLILFFAGLYFDARDPERTTRLSGTGFWMHFFAAPIMLSAALTIVNWGFVIDITRLDEGAAGGPLMNALQGNQIDAVRSAIATLGVIAAFAVVSLLINRRALIVAGLISAGIALGVLVNQLGLGAAGVTAVTLLLLGAVVVLLGAAWNPVRSILLTPFPSSGPLARIFPPVTPGQEG
jgi:hypothetical protein